MYLSFTSRYLGLVFQCSCIPISSSKYKKDTFSLYVVMHFPFQLRSITSSCPSGAFFRYSHFWLLYGFRIGSDRITLLAGYWFSFLIHRGVIGFPFCSVFRIYKVVALSGAFFRCSHLWLLYGFRIGSDRSYPVFGSDRSYPARSTSPSPRTASRFER